MNKTRVLLFLILAYMVACFVFFYEYTYKDVARPEKTQAETQAEKYERIKSGYDFSIFEEDFCEPKKEKDADKRYYTREHIIQAERDARILNIPLDDALLQNKHTQREARVTPYERLSKSNPGLVEKICEDREKDRKNRIAIRNIYINVLLDSNITALSKKLGRRYSAPYNTYKTLIVYLLIPLLFVFFCMCIHALYKKQQERIMTFLYKIKMHTKSIQLRIYENKFLSAVVFFMIFISIMIVLIYSKM